MFIYAIGSKEKEVYEAMRRTDQPWLQSLIPGTDVCQGTFRMRDRLFAAKRMPILAIVNLFPLQKNVDIHTPWTGYP